MESESNCSTLDTYTGFATYVGDMRRITSENLTVLAMQRCRTEICSTLYGTGNADISGVGVVFGYFIQLTLGIVLTLTYLVITPLDCSATLKGAITKTYLKYGDATLMLAFSIQVAAVVLGAKKNFSISAVDFGGLTIEVTFAAALLTILPMILVCAIPAERSVDDLMPPTEMSETASETRHMSLFWITLSWFLFLFTFVSRMLNEYSTGQVGTGKDPVIYKPEERNIWTLCFEGLPTPSSSERVAWKFFAIGGSVYALITILVILFLAGWKQHPFSQKQNQQQQSPIQRKRNKILIEGLLIFNTLLWGVPQLWTILRIRTLQQSLADSMDVHNSDNGWSFGQIIAIVVFLPVLAQFVYEFVRRALYRGGGGAVRIPQTMNQQQTTSIQR